MKRKGLNGNGQNFSNFGMRKADVSATQRILILKNIKDKLLCLLNVPINLIWMFTNGRNGPPLYGSMISKARAFK